MKGNININCNLVKQPWIWLKFCPKIGQHSTYTALHDLFYVYNYWHHTGLLDFNGLVTNVNKFKAGTLMINVQSGLFAFRLNAVNFLQRIEHTKRLTSCSAVVAWATQHNKQKQSLSNAHLNGRDTISCMQYHMMCACGNIRLMGIRSHVQLS